MPTPSVDDIRPLLRSREVALNKIVLGAFDRWWNNPERLQLYRRTRATLIHNYMMIAAPTAFSTDPGVRLIDRNGHETSYFLIEGRVLLRFKKGDENGLTCNIDTQAALAFVDPEVDNLLGLPEIARLDVAYVLSELATRVEKILIVARDGDAIAWSYEIYPTAEETTAPTPIPTQPKPPAPPSTVIDLPANIADKKNKNT